MKLIDKEKLKQDIQERIDSGLLATHEELIDLVDSQKVIQVRDCDHCKHKKPAYDNDSYESCEKWECEFEPRETMPELKETGKHFDKFCENVDCQGK